MLRLSIEQFERLEALEQSRQAAAAASVLAQAYAAVRSRLGDRFGAFVEAAMAQAARHGLVHPLDRAGYAGLWCLWGPGFDAKPGFEWAREILADPLRTPTLKLHQLRHRSRDELGRRGAEGAAAGGVGVADFDAALGAVDAGMAGLAAAQPVFASDLPRLPVRACDIGSIDLRIVEPADRQEYRPAESGWQRVGAPPPALPDAAWQHVDAPLAPRVLLGHALRAGGATRINLKLQMQAVCDPRVHAEVVHTDGVQRLAWHGRDAARLSVPVYAAPPDGPAAGAIAALLPAAPQSLVVTACGLRDAGAPFGAWELALQVQPATQWLMQIQHPAWLPMTWPNADAVPPPVAHCRLEADGTPRPAAASQAAWAGLQAAVRAGLGKLFEAWSRALDGDAPRLDAQVAALMGQADLTWGWQRQDADTVAMRCAAVLDLVACALDLGLAGEVVQGAARARLRVVCQGRTDLCATPAGAGDLGPVFAATRAQWRYPLQLTLEPLAGAGFATLALSGAAAPAGAAIVGECGLRARPDGFGWEWYFGLRLEPLELATTLADPLLGVAQQARTLLPAMTLVDWSAL